MRVLFCEFRIGDDLGNQAVLCKGRQQNTNRRNEAKVRIVTWSAALLIAVGMNSASGWAETPAPFPEFSAKRVSPPQQGAKKRITVQITTPVARAAGADDVRADTVLVEDGSVPGSARYDWFWDTISPDIAQSGPGRLEPALSALAKGPDGSHVPAPRLQDLQGIAMSRGLDILRSTVGTEVSPALVLAVIAVESGGRPDAVSAAGAQGLMQLMPATAERFGVIDALSPEDNIKGGVAFLDLLMRRFQADPIMVLAGYNAGETALADHAGVPPFAETRDYVPKVLAAYKVAKGLCVTPPELITDGCIFVVNAS